MPRRQGWQFLRELSWRVPLVVGKGLYEAITRDRWSVDLEALLIAGGGWIFGWVVRYILSGYRGVKPIRPQETE